MRKYILTELNFYQTIIYRDSIDVLTKTFNSYSDLYSLKVLRFTLNHAQSDAFAFLVAQSNILKHIHRNAPNLCELTFTASTERLYLNNLYRLTNKINKTNKI